jgi:cytochrome b
VSAAPVPPRAIAVWDPLVRIAHWALAAAVLGAFFLDDDYQAWHERLGYAALAVVAVRLLWGFVGTQHARFRDFVRPLSVVKGYARALLAGTEPRYVGHNPLGGLWIIVLLVLVVAAGVSGWALSVLGEDEYEWLEDLHEALANGLIGAVLVHLAGVAWGSIRHGENLVRAMLTGRKRPPGRA